MKGKIWNVRDQTDTNLMQELTQTYKEIDTAYKLLRTGRKVRRRKILPWHGISQKGKSNGNWGRNPQKGNQPWERGVKSESPKTQKSTTRPHERPRPSTLAAVPWEGASDCEHHDCSGNRNNRHRNVQRSIRTHHNGHRHYQELEKKQMNNNVYGIYDNCVMGYITIFTEREDKVAERNFKIALTGRTQHHEQIAEWLPTGKAGKIRRENRALRKRKGEYLRWCIAV